MRLRVPALLMIALHSVAFGQTHFKQVRPVIVSDPAKQAFLAVDESILQRIRSDMGDIRLFSASGKEVPYVLRTQRAVRYSDWTSMQVVNKGTLNGQTQFTVDVSVPEYDGVELDLATKDFVTRAGVEGADDAAAKVWNNLGAYSIYDFTKEKLGSSKIIHLKTPVRYRFLRITIGGEVMPEDVQGVNIANFQEDKAHFVPLSPQARIEQLGNHTTASWNASEKLPIERIGVEVEPSEVNFSRDATLYCDDRLVSHNNLSRVRLVRKGRQIESESLAIEPSALRCKSYRLDIFNGDNPPLHITAVKPMMLERRIYFDPQGETEFKLYYEDEKTGAPVYDYAKFFEPAEAHKVAAAELKAEASNPSFTEWPDHRPFTERHPAVLWIAMLVAVGLLGAWALKGFKS
ncbi:MAG TPA: DUF3999 family protein [Terriglobales bacterium]|nr:DUF3999 family protein [Terriglobales bacterium]